jgi:putative membrane protein
MDFCFAFDIPYQRSARQSPLQILRKRFAAGQVTAEEYQQRKKILEADLAKR